MKLGNTISVRAIVYRLWIILICLACFASQAKGQDAAPLPARLVTEYALISSYNVEYNDPGNWRLLGSNDGRSWTLLDSRSNQVFKARSQRLSFKIPNQTAFNSYRLEISGGSQIQLAELELIGPLIGITNEDEVYANVSASGAYSLVGPGENALDGDPWTRWIDFDPHGTGHWLQCEYTLQAAIPVTNISQFVVMSRRAAARNPLAGKAGKILSILANPNSLPVRNLTGYALTSANDLPQRDPRDWRLLGSNDGGKTWDTLDERRNETFASRFQKRAFTLTHHVAYAIYRLAIDSVRVPDDANSLQLAGIEPQFADGDSDKPYSVAVSVRGDNPPNESAEKAFDHDPKTKWLDFAEGQTNRSSWVQWQYLPDQGIPIINLNRLRSMRDRPLRPLLLGVEGVVVSWTTNNSMLGLLDETGFQLFKLDGPVETTIQPGDRVRLTGLVPFDHEQTLVEKPQLVSQGSVPIVARVQLQKPAGDQPRFFTSTIQGLVTSVSADRLHTEIQLTPDDSQGSMLVRVLNPVQARVPLFTHCRLKVRGVVEMVLDDNSKWVPGIIWADGWNDVALARPLENEWAQWPESSIHTLLNHDRALWLGNAVRVSGTVGEQNAGKILAIRQGTNSITAYAEETVDLQPGAPVEVVGFLDNDGSETVIRQAQFRTRTEPSMVEIPKPTDPIDDQHPITQIRKIYEMAKTSPAKDYPVNIRGVVTYIDLGLNDFYVQNGAEGILCNYQVAVGLAPYLGQEGRFVEVQGNVDTNGPPLSIDPIGAVKILGQGQWPEPREASWGSLLSGEDDCCWVKVEGVVSLVENQRLSLVMAGGHLKIWISQMDNVSPERLLGSLVAVKGVCSPLLDNRSQRFGVRLLVPSIEQVDIVKAAPENPFDLRTVPISRLMRFGTADTSRTVHLVKTKGVVTHSEPGFLFLQDGVEGLRIEPLESTDTQPGDLVEAVGLPAPDGFSPKLVQAQVRKIGHDPLPVATKIDLLEVDPSGQGINQDATRGWIEATLLGRSRNETVEILELRQAQSRNTFYAYLPVDKSYVSPIPLGSRVRLDGVFKAKTDAVADYGQTLTSFAMYLNSPADITVLERPPWWTTEHTLWILGGSGVALAIVLAWGGTLRNRVRLRTQELNEEIEEHKQTESRLESEIAERKRMQVQVEQTHKELLAASRQAGMAEVATSVLHNVGNVLNSVNVSTSLVADQLRTSKSVNLARAASLMKEHASDLGEFMMRDPKGRQLPDYLVQLSEHLANEKSAALSEIGLLQKNVQHIKDIVAMQQNYAKVSGVKEHVKLPELVEDALRMEAGGLLRHDVKVAREYDPQVPEVSIEKHKVLQILVNLVRNAKYACEESATEGKQLTVSVNNQADRIKISISDNGVGIPPENLTRIFNHGFTTRKDGHGFGLHSGALAARELGGSLSAQSDGAGKGATFTLELPAHPKNETPAPAARHKVAAS